MNKFHFCFLIFLVFIYSCKKDRKEDQSSTNITLSINQQGQTATFTGQISNISIDNVKQTGFVWSKNTEPITGSAGVFTYKNTSPGLQFNYNAFSGFPKDSTYYVKAFYIDNANNYHYSQQASFKSSGTKQPTLQSLLKSYTWGDEIELKMDTLNINDLNGIKVIINQVAAIPPTRVSGTKIYFKIPNDLSSAYNSLSVSVLGQVSNSIDLILAQPLIAPGNDVNLIAGSTLTINGQFFNPVLSKNIVTIGTTKLNVVSATANKLVVDYNNATISKTGSLTIQTGISLIVTSSTDYFIYKFLQPKKSFPGEAREGSVAVVLNGAIYTGLGKGRATNQSLKDWWKYDPATDVWTRLADCPQRALGANAFSLNNKAYIGLGVFDDYPSNAFYCYDPGSNTWTSINPFPGTQTISSAFFNSGQYGYIVGGVQRNSEGFIQVNDVWKFDPVHDSWKQLSPFPGSPRQQAAAFTLNNKGYVIGGVGRWTYIAEAWSFDFATETWKQVANLPSDAGWTGQFTFALNNKGYVGGGNNNYTDGINQSVYEYDTTADTWTKKEDILNPIVYEAASVSIGNIGYVICGWSNTFPYSEGSQSFFQFIP